MKQNEHGGNIHRLIRQNRIAKDRLIDFSANINPAGPPKWFRSLINRELGTIVHYPDPECVALKETIARKYRVDAKRIVPANGTTELLHLLPRVLEKKDILIPEPSYIDYRMVFQAQGYRVHSLMLTEESGYCIDPDVLAEKLGQVGAVIFANPTNPAGALISSESIVSLAEAFRQTLFIIDEAFYPFYTPFSTVGGKCGNLITLNSLTKFFAIPGLRAGFGIFPEWGREKIRRLLPQWSVNSLAQSFAVTALEDDAYCRDSCEACVRLRENLFAEINTIPGLKAYPSAANFLLLRSGNQITAKKLYEKLLSNQMIIRRCDNYRGLDEYSFRIAVRSAQENQRLLEALRLVYLLPGSGKQRFRRKTPALMFQGTSSNAGKSILAAALCRILFQDGVKVAPF
ncbi:MAG: threonine-phosphate decarboxylase, partial [Proteobacteria bacterium]